MESLHFVTLLRLSITNDKEKIDLLIKRIKRTINRIGVVKEDSNRAIKINTNSIIESQNQIITLAPNIKSIDAPWNEIYEKKAVHPVYVKEDFRIRKKKKQ